MATHTKQNRIKRRSCIDLALLFSISLTSMQGFASPSVYDLLDYGPPKYMSSPMAATVTFLQSSGDATSIQKITLNYFTTTDCSGTTAGTYTTPDGTSYTINTSTTFGLNAISTYSVGATQAGLNMSTINSVAIFLKSQNANTPQANFTGSSCGTNPSFCCVQIDCSSGTECTQTSAIGTQNFQLKTTAAIGDPADGGLIGCMNGGLNNLVVPASDNSAGIEWGGDDITTGATSTTDGATNTSTIVTELGAGTTYAAGLCNAYTTTGGFTSGWFLPAGNNLTSSGQLNCLYTNSATIGGFASTQYWSSTETTSTLARIQNLSNGNQNSFSKTNIFRVRCARAFTP